MDKLTKFLIALRNFGVNPTACELADALWFASHIRPLIIKDAEVIQDIPTHSETNKNSDSIPKQQNIEPSITPHEVTFKEKIEVKSADKNKNISKSETNKKPESKESEQKSEMSIDDKQYPIAMADYKDKVNGDEGEKIEIPAVRYLDDALLLERALRPLIYKSPLQNTRILDEAETTKFIAEQDIWLPIFRDSARSWFEILLIVDKSPTMVIWDGLVAEWRNLLQRHVAFSVIHEFSFEYEKDRVKLCIHSNRYCKPTELVDYTGNKIILIISDCMSSAWYSGEITKFLEIWEKSNPIAIINVLPQRLWHLSGLSSARKTDLRAISPGLANNKLIIYDSKKSSIKSVKVPVFNLDEEDLNLWANSIMGKNKDWISGFIFKPSDSVEQKDYFNQITNQINEMKKPSAEDRIQRFYSNSSDMARELAMLLALVPLSLPVMRLVQHTALKESKLVHLAEFFLSGLIKKEHAGECEYIEYEFHDGVRQILLDKYLNMDIKKDVFKKTTEYLHQNFGSPLSFKAYLLDPDNFDRKSKKVKIDPKHRQFAYIAEQVLKSINKGTRNIYEDLMEYPKLRSFRHKLEDETYGPMMVKLIASKFIMGSSEGYPREKPEHNVRINKVFAIGKYAITIDEYFKFCNSQNIKWDYKSYKTENAKHPVTYADWHDAKRYCQWLSEQTGHLYRLPTEAEWEYACRAGSTGKWCFGDSKEQLKDYAWYDENSGSKTHPVGEKKPNQFGLYDMHGNVWEWCEDGWHESYNESPDDSDEWSSKNNDKLLRGGSCDYNTDFCRNSFRYRGAPDLRYMNIGFRVACTIMYLPEMVEIDETFLISKYPVTVGDFRKFVEDKKYKTEAEDGSGAKIWNGTNWQNKRDANWKNPYLAQEDNHPVVCINWNDARAYCKWLSQQTGQLYRLPTEEEWEYSCSAHLTAKWSFGNDENELKDYAWYNENSNNKTHPVGEKKLNPFGLYDMHGHVLEWCEDSGHDNHETKAFLRGGSWADAANSCRSDSRVESEVFEARNTYGFRLVCSIDK
jgi:formylglycine-generating enzyme required for sulfatase activity